MAKRTFSDFAVPHLDQRSIPIPQKIFFLTLASMVGSFVLLLISLLDLGILSLWVNPPLAFITLIYHAAVLLLSQKKRSPESPSYFSTVTFCAYIIAVVWLVAFIITVVVLAVYKNDYTPDGLRRHGLPVSDHTQRLQVFLTLYEFILVCGIGLTGHLMIIAEGDPETWRSDYSDVAHHDKEDRHIGHASRPSSSRSHLVISKPIPISDSNMTEFGQPPHTSFVNS